MTRTARVTLIVAVALVAQGCRRRLSPEEQVRAALDVVVTAIRELKIKPVAAALSDQYSDADGNDKKQIVALLRAQLLFHPNLYLVSKITSIQCPEASQAQVVVFAAMASVPAEIPTSFRNLSADVYRFELSLADEDGTWRVRSASWAPALKSDLF